MNRVKKFTALLVALLMALSLCACGNNGDNSNNKGSQNPSSDPNGSNDTLTPANSGVVSGTVVNFRLPVDVACLLPWAHATAANIYDQIYDTLFQPYKGDWNDIRGLLCTGYTMSDDGLTWVFQITDKATFSNGKPVDAKAIVDCYNYTIQFQPALFSNVESFEATGDYEITFHMSAPNPGLIANLANTYTGICDPEMVAQYGTESDEAAIGSGPYIVESKTVGSVTILKANPHYWNEEQQASIETINYWYIPDNNTAMAALQSGEIDVIDTNDYNTYEMMADLPGVTSQVVQDNCRSLYINGQSGALQDVRVRKAIQCFVDPVQAELAYHGGNGSVDGSFIRGICGYTVSCDVTYDVEKGKALLAEAGVDPTSLNLKLVTNSDIGGYSENIQSQLNAVGINVTIDTYDVTTSEAIIASGDFDLGLFRTDADVASGLVMSQTWLASTGTKRVMWGTEEENAEIDKLVAKAAAAITMEEQNAVLGELQKLILEELALAVPSPTPSRYYIYNDKLQNVTINNSTCRVDWRWAYFAE